MATIKQTLAAQEFVKVLNGQSEVKTKEELLAKVSYGKIARQPERILSSKGFLEVFNKYITDDDLATIHTGGLRAKKKEGKKWVEDWLIRHKYLDTAYKIRGNYAPTQTENKTININFNIKHKKLANKYEEELKKSYINNQE